MSDALLSCAGCDEKTVMSLTTGSKNTSALELKLKLLERRFTMPLSTSAKIWEGKESDDTYPNNLQAINHTSTTNSQNSCNFDSPALAYRIDDSIIKSSQPTHNDSSFAEAEERRIFQIVSNSKQMMDDTVTPEAVKDDALKMNKNIMHANIKFVNDKLNSKMVSQSSNHTVVTSHCQRKDGSHTAQDVSGRFYHDNNVPSSTSKIYRKQENTICLANKTMPIDTCSKTAFSSIVTKFKRKAAPTKCTTHSVKDLISTGSMSYSTPASSCSKGSLVDDCKNPKKGRVDTSVAIAPPSVEKKSQMSNDENQISNVKFNSIKTKQVCHESPLKQIHQNQLSRDSDRLGRSMRRTRVTTPVRPNSSIYDFFRTSRKSSSSSSFVKKEKINQLSQATEFSVGGQIEKKNHTMQQRDASATMEDLRKKCLELEQICQDKDQQLKAIANNRTILDSALRTALQKREDDMRTLLDEKNVMQTSFRNELEKFIRQDATRKARDVREKLAINGARLGRIVFTRTGSMMGRSSQVEVWEDGSATRDLEKKRAELLSKRLIFEKRLEVAKQELIGFRKDLNKSCDLGTPIAPEISSELNALAAVEASQTHILNLESQENELAVLELVLDDEKVSHIHTLKRIASEDASRFRGHPKLNERYVLQELLGKGGFSEVWRAYDLHETREVAVKIHQLDTRWSEGKKENYTKHVSREYEIHKSVRHPRIVSLFDVFEIDNNSFATVLECCNGTDLDTLLKVKKRFREPEARFILLQILAGMKYLSQPSIDGIRSGIIHYDLKPGNILFDEYGDAKITDFGLSKIIDASDATESMELTSQGAGTYWYLPPECFLTSDIVRISNKVDVWSIGVIFYQMLFGRRPFGDGQSQDTILANRTMLNARDVDFPTNSAVSEECKQFIRTCLTYDQTFRPNISQICDHHYIIQK